MGLMTGRCLPQASRTAGSPQVSVHGLLWKEVESRGEGGGSQSIYILLLWLGGFFTGSSLHQIGLYGSKSCWGERASGFCSHLLSSFSLQPSGCWRLLLLPISRLSPHSLLASQFFHIWLFFQPNNLAEVDRIGFIIPILKIINLNLGEITSKKYISKIKI